MTIQLNDNYDFAFDSDTKNFSIIYGVENLEQNIKIILNTFIGENKLYPTFGTRLQDLIGYNVSPNFIKYTVKQAILADPRYKEVTNLTVTRQSGKTVKIQATVKVAITNELIEITGEING